MDITTAPTADLVVLDDVTATDTSDNEGASTAAIGAACLAAGVAIGTFVVPPVVGWIGSWFTSSTPDVAGRVQEVMTETAPAEKAAV